MLIACLQLPGLREAPVTGVQDIMNLLMSGCNNRTTAATAMNKTSSRSHAIFTLNIKQENKNDRCSQPEITGLLYIQTNKYKIIYLYQLHLYNKCKIICPCMQSNNKTIMLLFFTYY